MQNEVKFFRNLFLVFASISILFSVFVFKTEAELSFFLLFIGFMIFITYYFIMTNFFEKWQKKRKLLGMPLLLILYFFLGLLFTFRLFYHNLAVEEEWLKMSGCSLSFHFFLGILAAIISWYSGINKQMK